MAPESDQPSDQSSPYDANFFDGQMDESRVSAGIVLRRLKSDFQIASLIDVGCGVGPWLNAAGECGIERLQGIDGDYVDTEQMQISPQFFVPWDLETAGFSDALQASSPFDIAISMEVAEHLTPERASSFISEICQLSDLVLFSAAVPNQGGLSHLNEQPPQYWAEKFADNGFDCFDYLRQELWDEEGCCWWYLQNMLIFAKKGTKAHVDALKICSHEPSPHYVLHPRAKLKVIEDLLVQIAELNSLCQLQPFGKDETIRNLEEKVDYFRTQLTERKKNQQYLKPRLSRAARRIRNALRVLRGKPTDVR